MTIIERLQLRTGETDTALLADLAETAKNAILSRRFPYGNWPTENGETYVEPRYVDLQFRIALDLYDKIGAEGELRHAENGITREYESSWVSGQLLREVIPWVGVPE
jgi:hypothetical protein